MVASKSYVFQKLDLRMFKESANGSRNLKFWNVDQAISSRRWSNLATSLELVGSERQTYFQCIETS